MMKQESLLEKTSIQKSKATRSQPTFASSSQEYHLSFSPTLSSHKIKKLSLADHRSKRVNPSADIKISRASSQPQNNNEDEDKNNNNNNNKHANSHNHDSTFLNS
jgi:hypothetical protein